MKVYFQVEGAIDRRALRSIVGVALAREIEPVEYRRRAGGIHEVLRTLKESLWDAWRIGCVGAVVHVDANGSVRHDEHEADAPSDCRHCGLVSGLPALPTRHGQPDLAIATAVPVEAIEAWLLHLRDRREPNRTRSPHRLPRLQAKERLWGTRTPDPATVDSVCDEIFAGLTASDLEELASSQPSFAQFLGSLRTWPNDDVHPGASAG